MALTKINMLSKEIGIFYFASLIIIILIAISGAYGSFSYAVHTAYGESNSIINNINNNKNTTYDISGAKSVSITTNSTANTAADTSSRDNIVPYVGVDMQGYYTSMPQTRNFTIPYFPSNYYEDSFRLISQSGMNHVRYVFYWESYIRNPDQFIDELNTVAKTADKYNIHVIYANHQFHTSSWLDPKNGVGFPSLLFKNDSNNHSLSLYPYGSGGSPKSKVAQIWWTNWLDRNIKDTNGDDGWELQADFLKKVVNTVEKHPSTLGYEILGESQVHKIDEWDKLGQYNTFMTDILRKITPKTIVFSMSTPVDLDNQTIGVTAENIARTIPTTPIIDAGNSSDKNATATNTNAYGNRNFVFKFDVYDLPTPTRLEGKRLDIFAKAGQIAKVPLYAGEWSVVARKKNSYAGSSGGYSTSLDPANSDMNLTQANYIVKKLEDMRVWGMAYWRLKFEPDKTPTYNLINVIHPSAIATTTTNSTIQISGFTSDSVAIIHPTKYFEILKNTHPERYKK
ncbi:MAG TPA: cellulase family glycosylhydrolase [Nitrososphaeraceae archaeon]|nr:cellulase family glycosylhydrolase [Nitrososphaeraceae archaeon]